MLLRSNFSSFPQYFQYNSNFKSPVTYTFVKCACSIYFFLKSANLIWRSTAISKYFRESLGVRDNESRPYIGRVYFRYVRLYDVDIPKEKWFNYLQTVETLIRWSIMLCLIWFCTVCHLPFRVSSLQWVNKGKTDIHVDPDKEST